MKLVVTLFVVSLLSYSSAFFTPEEAKADVVAHVEPQIFKLLSKPGIARAGGGIKCYDKYLPLITAATENSKADTEACISRAASRREDELNKVKTERENLDSQVHNVEETLTVCLKKSDDLEYLKCLKENSIILQNALNEVGKTSSSLSDNLSLSYKSIDAAEDLCIKTVIAKSKSVSDELLAALQNCLMNGLDDGSNGGSNGESDDGTNGGSNGDADGGANGDSDDNFNAGTDSNSNGDSDGGSNGASDNGSNGDDDSNAGSDSGSNGGSNGDTDGGSDGGSNGGPNDDTNAGSDNGSGAGSDGGSDGGTDIDSQGGTNDGADSGVVPNADAMPEEDLTP